MKTFLAIIFATVIPFTAAIAQKPTKGGFIITIENDTLEGVIIDHIDATLSTSVEFSKDINGEKKSYSPSDLEGFGFHSGRTFIKVPHADKSGDSLYFFAKKVLQGKVSLFIRRKPNRDQPDIFLANNSLHREALLVPPSKEPIDGDDGKKFLPDEFKHLGLLNYIKDDPAVKGEKKMKRIRYNEKDIIKDITDYNNSYASSFPTFVYQEQRDISYDITAGLLPIPREGDQQVYFRLAMYRNKTFPEKSRTISFMRGISYRYWQSTKGPEPGIENTNQNYRQQFLGLMPIGVHFHTAKGFIRPYIYCALGLSILVSSEYNIVDYVDKGSRTLVYPFPAINLGAGIKIKVASKFIIAELTPAMGAGMFLNIGYSF